MSDDDREGDPFEEFEEFGEVTDREGDPFEEFEQPSDSGSEPSAPDVDAPAIDPDPVDTDADKSGTVTELDGDPLLEMGPPDDDPFGDFEGRAGDPFADDESVFERVDVGDIDADRVWEDIAGDDEQAPSPTGSRYADVSKHRYCEQCEHFSEPPAVHCSNEGTEIVEFVDMETVRLLDCPIVAEQRKIADDE